MSILGADLERAERDSLSSSAIEKPLVLDIFSVGVLGSLMS